MKITIAGPACEKPECLYYTDISLDLGEPQPKGKISHRHCVMCKHLIKYDFYTRLVVGKEEEDGS